MNQNVGSYLLLFVQFFKIYWSIFFCHPIDVPLIYHKFGNNPCFLLKVAA